MPTSDAEDILDPINSSTAIPSDLPSRSLNFVRSKIRQLKSENDSLRKELDETNHKLYIISTSQTWAMEHAGSKDSPWSQEQAQKIRELELLLTKLREAKIPATVDVSGKLKVALAAPRAENKDMRERLRRAVDQGKILHEENKQLKNEALSRKVINPDFASKREKLEKLSQEMHAKIGGLRMNIPEP